MFRLILFLFLAINVELHSANPPANGKVKTYFKNGKMEMVGHYKNGLKHRTWMYYSEDGKVLYKEKYKAGELQWESTLRKRKGF